MVSKKELSDEIQEIFSAKWETREGQVVPESPDLKLTNDAILLKGTVLYADLDGSTNLVDSFKPFYAAKIYKAYLKCVAKIIVSEDGVITAYDGDRIMAIFLGDSKNSTATRTALKINWAVKNIVNPALKIQYPKDNYSIEQVVGVDTSDLFVARTGIRGSNDLVWVGRAANYAAKLSNRSGPATQITSEVYNALNEKSKYGSDGINMWQQDKSIELGYKTIYTSTYWWEIT
jgi:class 3 adenylate cyclase